MFTAEELDAITAMCDTEEQFLKQMERRSPVVVADAQAVVAVIRAKAKRECERLRKVETQKAAGAK